MTFRWKIAQWFELRWWKTYLDTNNHSAYKAWKKNYWQNLLEKIAGNVKLSKTSSVIDLGCGPAGIFMNFPDNPVIAVDPLINNYETKTSFFKRKDYPNVVFENCTIEDFKPSQKFDVVFCMNAINHVHDIQMAFNRIKAICKDDGVIVISIDAHNYSIFKYLFRTIPGDILHPHQYDLAEYANMLSLGKWQLHASIRLKHEFFFSHYLLVAQKLSSPQ